MSNCSIWTKDMNLSGATTPDQCGPGSNGKEVILNTPQNSKVGASPSDCLMSYLRHLQVEPYSSARMQLKYSKNPCQVLPLQIRVDREAMAKKWYSTISKIPRLDPHYQIV